MKNITVGIDYSMNAPAVCIHTGNNWNPDNCKFYWHTNVKKCQIKTNSLQGDPTPVYNCADDLNSLERWEANANWIIGILNDLKDDIKIIGLEGYSYGSKGSLPFSIAENTAILKYKLKQMVPLKLKIFSPGAIKKYATTKGNAKKMQMFESFIADSGIDLIKYINSKPESNPISDIVDSYWICKYALEYDKQR